MDKSPTSSNPFHNTQSKDAIEKLPSVSSLGAFLASLNQTSNNSRLRRFLDETGSLDVNISDTNSCHLSDISSVSNTFYNHKDVNEEEEDNESLGCETNASFDNIIDSASSYRSEDGSIEDFENEDKGENKESKNDYVDIIDMVNNNYISDKRFSIKRNGFEEVYNNDISTEKPQLDEEIKNFMSFNTGSTPIHQANLIEKENDKKQERSPKVEHKKEIENIQLQSFSPPSVIHNAEMCSDFKTNEINTEKSLIKIKSQSFNNTDSFKSEPINQINDEAFHDETAPPQEGKKCDVYENKFVTNNLKDLKMSNDILLSSKKQQTKSFTYNSSKASKVTLEFFCSKVGENNSDGKIRIKDTFRLHKLQNENMDNINTISELFKSHTTSEAKAQLVKNNDFQINAQNIPSELTTENYNNLPITTNPPKPVQMTPPMKAAPIASKRTLKTKDQVFPGTAKRVENKSILQNHLIRDNDESVEQNFKSLKENGSNLEKKSNLIPKKTSEEDRTNKVSKKSKITNENKKPTKTETLNKNVTTRVNDISEKSGIKKSKTLEFGKEDIEMSLQEIRSLLYGKEQQKDNLEGMGKIEYEERAKSIRDYVNVAKSKSFHTNPFYDLDNEIERKLIDNNHEEKIKSKKFHSSESKINQNVLENNDKLEIRDDDVSIRENKIIKGNKLKQKKIQDKVKDLKNENLDLKSSKSIKEIKKVKKVPGGLKKVVNKSKLSQENNADVFLNGKNDSCCDKNIAIELNKEEKTEECFQCDINEKNSDKNLNKEQKKKESNKKTNDKQKLYKENGKSKKLSDYEMINSNLSSEIDMKETLNYSGPSIIKNYENVEDVGVVKDEKAIKNGKINELNIVDAKNDVSLIEADENEVSKEKIYRMKKNKNNFCNVVYSISNGDKYDTKNNDSNNETHSSKESKKHTKTDINKETVKSIDIDKSSPKETNIHKNTHIDYKTESAISMSVIDELLEELRKSHIDNNCMEEVYPLNDDANDEKNCMYGIDDNALEEGFLFRNCVEDMYKDKGPIDDLTEIYNIKDAEDKINECPTELETNKDYDINDEKNYENHYNKESLTNKNKLFNYQINYDIGNRLYNYKNKNGNNKVKNSKNPFLSSDTENECHDKEVQRNEDDLNQNDDYDNNRYRENNFLFKSDEKFSKNTNNVFNNDFVNEYNHYNNYNEYDDGNDDYNSNDFNESLKENKTFTLSPELTECESVASIISRNNSNDNYTNGDDKDNVRKTDDEDDDEDDEKKDDDDDMSPTYMPHVFDGLSSNDENNEDNDRSSFQNGNEDSNQLNIKHKPITEKQSNGRKIRNNYNENEDGSYDNNNELTSSLLINKENNIQKVSENKYNARHILKHEDKPLPNIAYNKETSKTTHKHKKKMNDHENKHKSSEKYKQDKQKQHDNTEEKQKIDAKTVKCNSNERVHNKTDDIFIRKSRHPQKGNSRKGLEKQVKGDTYSDGSTELKKECLKISFCSVEEYFFKKTRTNIVVLQDKNKGETEQDAIEKRKMSEITLFQSSMKHKKYTTNTNNNDKTNNTSMLSNNGNGIEHSQHSTPSIRSVHSDTKNNNNNGGNENDENKNNMIKSGQNKDIMTNKQIQTKGSDDDNEKYSAIKNKNWDNIENSMNEENIQNKKKSKSSTGVSKGHVDNTDVSNSNTKKANSDDRDKRGSNADKESFLIEGVLFRAQYLGSTQLVSEGQPSKAARLIQAQEAINRIKDPVLKGNARPGTLVDLFVSVEKIMVLNTDLQEIMMDHALRTISYIADIGDVLVIMARRGPISNNDTNNNELDNNNSTNGKIELDAKAVASSHLPTNHSQAKICCHVFESNEAQLIAQSISQAFQVAYVEFLKANGINDPDIIKVDYQDVLSQQEVFGEELFLFSNRDMQKEVLVSKLKGEPLGMVIVESGWGSMVPTVVLANMAPGGAAARGGQLNIGDQIISVNGISLVGLPLSTCQAHLKALKTEVLARFMVVSCTPVVEVLVKRPDIKYQLGFSVQNGVICSLLRGGIAERGGVRVGHRIIEINGQSVVAVPHDKIVSTLASSVGEIHMKTMQTSIYRLLTGQDTPHYI